MTPSCKKFSFSLFSSTVARGFVACAALTLSLAGCGGSGDDNDPVVDSPPIFTTFQEASVVIGQKDFTYGDPNQGGGVGANTLSSTWGETLVIDEQLYVVDSGNNRVLRYNGIPDVNNANATFVLGQGDFASNGITQLNEPVGLAIAPDGRLFVSDFYNKRVLIWASPESTEPPVALATSDGTCSTSRLFGSPSGLTIVGNKLIVVDTTGHRVLIWNTLPTTGTESADLVLGQSGVDDCDNTSETRNPYAAWSDGEKLVVADYGGGRVLIWNSFPSTSSEPPQVILSKANNSSDLSWEMAPSGVFFTGAQLLVSDGGGNRVLVWDGFPGENDELPDRVLGQQDFVHTEPNAGGTLPSARTLYWPGGLFVYGKQLFVSDAENNRTLVFDSQ